MSRVERIADRLSVSWFEHLVRVRHSLADLPYDVKACANLDALVDSAPPSMSSLRYDVVDVLHDECINVSASLFAISSTWTKCSRAASRQREPLLVTRNIATNFLFCRRRRIMRLDMASSS